MLKEDSKNEKLLDDDINTIKAQSQRMAKIIENIRTFAIPSKGEFFPLNINKPIEDAFSLLTEQLKIHRIKITKNLATDLPLVNCDTNQLQQVFLNLIINARDALDTLDKDAKKEIAVTTKYLADKNYVEILFNDTGSGISPEIIDKIFDPFFTTKSPNKGIGLGLSICYSIIQTHKGTITVNSEQGKGTTFRILLPVG